MPRCYPPIEKKFCGRNYFMYPYPRKPYILFTDVSKDASVCVLAQSYVHETDGKKTEILHHIS